MAPNVTRTARAAGVRAQRLVGRLQGLRLPTSRRRTPRPWLIVMPAIGALMTAATTALLWDERRRKAARERAASAAQRLKGLPERAAAAARNGREHGAIELTAEPESPLPERPKRPKPVPDD